MLLVASDEPPGKYDGGDGGDEDNMSVLGSFDAVAEARRVLECLQQGQRAPMGGAFSSVPSSPSSSPSQPMVQARDYQRQMFERAVARNTICMLGTGLGKTFIAVMVVREILSKRPGTKAIIVCPTAFLVDQQSDVFQSNTPYKVGAYHGGRVEDWTPERWELEWRQGQVLVMTPQVLVNALNHACISLDSVSCVVVDECHHVAAGDHPMRQFMQRVAKMTEAPRVLGLTASPLVSVPKDLSAELAALEASMAGSKLATADVGHVFRPRKRRPFSLAIVARLRIPKCCWVCFLARKRTVQMLTIARKCFARSHCGLVCVVELRDGICWRKATPSGASR